MEGAWYQRSNSYRSQGGATIEQLRQSTQANIKVERETPGCPERLIYISSPNSPTEPLCRAQEALLCVQDRLASFNSSETVHMVRMMQMGVLLAFCDFLDQG